MKDIRIKTTDVELTDAIRDYVNEKVGQLERHFGSEPTNIDVELEKESGRNSGPIYRCEVNIEVPGEAAVIRADSNEADLYAAIDTCIPKLKEQLEHERKKRDTLIKKGGREFKEILQSMDSENI